MFFFELIMILIVICTFAYWFGSAIIAALSSFFGTAIAIAILILSMPITLLLTRKDRKNSDDIYDRLQAVKKKGDDYLLECSLDEQLDESRNKIGTKMNIIIIFHIIAITILIIYFYIFM